MLHLAGHVDWHSALSPPRCPLLGRIDAPSAPRRLSFSRRPPLRDPDFSHPNPSPNSNTPAFRLNDQLTLVKKHDNGWLEIATAAGTRGYVSPAWVELTAEPTTPTPTPTPTSTPAPAPKPQPQPQSQQPQPQPQQPPLPQQPPQASPNLAAAANSKAAAPAPPRRLDSKALGKAGLRPGAGSPPPPLVINGVLGAGATATIPGAGPLLTLNASPRPLGHTRSSSDGTGASVSPITSGTPTTATALSVNTGGATPTASRQQFRSGQGVDITNAPGGSSLAPPQIGSQVGPRPSPSSAASGTTPAKQPPPAPPQRRPLSTSHADFQMQLESKLASGGGNPPLTRPISSALADESITEEVAGPASGSLVTADPTDDDPAKKSARPSRPAPMPPPARVNKPSAARQTNSLERGSVLTARPNHMHLSSEAAGEESSTDLVTPPPSATTPTTHHGGNMLLLPPDPNLARHSVDLDEEEDEEEEEENEDAAAYANLADDVSSTDPGAVAAAAAVAHPATAAAVNTLMTAMKPTAGPAISSFEGVLQRREGVRKKWTSYEAQLTNGMLALFRDRDRRRPLFSILVRDMEMVREPDVKGKSSVVFTLRQGERDNYSFRAANEAAFQQWLTALREYVVVVGDVGPRTARPSVVPQQSPARASVSYTPGGRGAALANSGGSMSPAGPLMSAASTPSSSRQYSAQQSLLQSGSQEDLSTEDAAGGAGTASSPKDSAANYGYVRKKLNKYLRARPKKQELVSKGIIEEPVFGGTIERIVLREQGKAPLMPNVPIVICKCVPRVDLNLDEQGIYRVSGNSSEIQKLVAKANQDSRELVLDDTDVHAATGLLKLYFRELAEPAFTDALYPEFIAAGSEGGMESVASTAHIIVFPPPLTGLSDPSERQQRIQQLIKRLPASHRATLAYLFRHLLRVAKHGDVNKMHTNNIAIVFGPVSVSSENIGSYIHNSLHPKTLLRGSEPTPEIIVMDAPYQSSVVEEILKHVEWLEA